MAEAAFHNTAAMLHPDARPQPKPAGHVDAPQSALETMHRPPTTSHFYTTEFHAGGTARSGRFKTAVFAVAMTGPTP